MIEAPDYLMESEDEIKRLEMKTDVTVAEKQARWAGIKPGMRVADIGCGSGKVSKVLYDITQPGGTVVGFDISEKRLEFAAHNYGSPGIEFVRRDIRQPLEGDGLFDFVWIRFVLEYYLAESVHIVKNAANILKPGGILCLIDLDDNSLIHYKLTEYLEGVVDASFEVATKFLNFDPLIGRKLYPLMYEMGFKHLDVQVSAHHILYGELNEAEKFNWFKKIDVAARVISTHCPRYKNDEELIRRELKRYITDPERFAYTPLICCRGVKPD